MKTMVKLCVVALVALAVGGCAPCPKTPPPADAEASAILLSVRSGLSAAQPSIAAAKSPSYARAVGHALSLDASNFWCEAASLYDELVTFEKDAVAGGAPIPPELTQAITLMQWAVDHAACNCTTAS